MKSKELRIGNFVFNEDEKSNNIYLPVQVTGIDYKSRLFCDISYVSRGSVYIGTNDIKVRDVSNFFDIPLDDEWIYNFGFDYNNDEFSYGNYKIKCIDKGNITVYSFFKCDKNHECFLVSLKYVHQLQNIYFFLEGEDLIIRQNL